MYLFLWRGTFDFSTLEKMHEKPEFENTMIFFSHIHD